MTFVLYYLMFVPSKVTTNFNFVTVSALIVCDRYQTELVFRGSDLKFSI